jgi:dephospho-CoA kinase
MPMPKPVVGLLGGMGSGKSRVAAELAALGGRVLNADQFGHEALRQPEIRERLVQRWGEKILDETEAIVRGRVARIVFSDAAERQWLEAQVHPYIARRVREEVAAAQADPAVTLIVLDAAIMLEAGWDSVCDRLIYVHAPRAERLRRLAEQRGWSAKEVEARERAQLSLTAKATRADYVVDNSGPPEHLARQIRDLVREWGGAVPVGEGRSPAKEVLSWVNDAS